MMETKNPKLDHCNGSNSPGKCEEKGYFKPNERSHKGVHYPEFWKKKKMRLPFVRELEETASKPAVITDSFGSYKDGLFLHGCAIVRVTINKSGLWLIEIHSERPIGMTMIQDIRYRFAPDEYLMAYLLPTRGEKSGSYDAALYQIPEKTEEA